jgi:glycerophosphoryl diester phosphodiesterase
MARAETRFLDGPRPRNIGHRGAAGHAPENTLVSFRMALEMGADILELDVHGTRDGSVVISHDATVDRTTEGEGPIARMTLAEIAKLDAGYRWTSDGKLYPYRGQGVRIPTLLELLETFPDAPLNIEIKQAEPPIVDDVVKLLQRHGREPIVNLAAETPAIMSAIRTSAWRGATGYSMADAVAFMDALAGGRWSEYTPPGVALQVPERWQDVEVVTETFVHAAHAAGVEVHVWTVNHRADMDRLLDLGVDGLVTDFPDVARQAIDHFVDEGSRATGL